MNNPNWWIPFIGGLCAGAVAGFILFAIILVGTKDPGRRKGQ